jgi:hypothetical protein
LQEGRKYVVRGEGMFSEGGCQRRGDVAKGDAPTKKDVV